MHQSNDLLAGAVRMIRFVAAYPVVPKPSLLRASADAVESAAELQGAALPQTRRVLAFLNQGIVPSQQACDEAAGEIMTAREHYRLTQSQGDSQSHAAPRG